MTQMDHLLHKQAGILHIKLLKLAPTKTSKSDI